MDKIKSMYVLSRHNTWTLLEIYHIYSIWPWQNVKMKLKVTEEGGPWPWRHVSFPVGPVKLNVTQNMPLDRKEKPTSNGEKKKTSIWSVLSADQIPGPLSLILSRPLHSRPSQDASLLPSLLQRTQASPLLGFGVKAFHRVKQLPVGAST